MNEMSLMEKLLINERNCIFNVATILEMNTFI